MKQFEIWIVDLEPVKGSEIAKTRPCVVISDNRMNRWLNTSIVAPLTRTQKGWPSRVPIRFHGKDGEIALDQMRAVDRKERAMDLHGSIDVKIIEAVKKALAKMFS